MNLKSWLKWTDSSPLQTVLQARRMKWCQQAAINIPDLWKTENILLWISGPALCQQSTQVSFPLKGSMLASACASCQLLYESTCIMWSKFAHVQIQFTYIIWPHFIFILVNSFSINPVVWMSLTGVKSSSVSIDGGIPSLQAIIAVNAHKPLKIKDRLILKFIKTCRTWI